MPEIGEVARAVHHLRTALKGRLITSVTAHDDPIVYGKVGTSAAAFQSAIANRRVLDADRQGKYFYMTLDGDGPHAVMHFGMTGWLKVKGKRTEYYKQAKVEEKNKEEEWPPKYVKFVLKTDKDGEEPEVEVAFVDARRLARIRLVDCPAEEIRNHSPLKENGPDPVRDKDVVTVKWLEELMNRKRVPIKALLLDQANLSGVGNWVADEILYQARLHPEQYCNTFSEAQIGLLHEKLMSVCTLAVETLADSTKFPDDWIMKYRWDKGKKNANTLPDGSKIVHITVGGRTSAVVPLLQKKTGAVAGDINVKDEPEARNTSKEGIRKRQHDQDANPAEEDQLDASHTGVGRRTKRASTAAIKQEPEEATDSPTTKRQQPGKGKASKTETPKAKKSEKPPTPGSRRSTRNM